MGFNPLIPIGLLYQIDGWKNSYKNEGIENTTTITHLKPAIC